MSNWQSRYRLSGVYAITDANLIPSSHLASAVEDAILGGAQIIQYRNKTGSTAERFREAEALQYLCQRYAVPLIINDDVELARSCRADGVHLGDEDTDPRRARDKLGDDVIIGVSCYHSLDKALIAQRSGANYVAFGSFFPSRTKPNAVAASIDLLQMAKQTLAIPICAIGGISADNATTLLPSGVDMLAVVSAIFDQPDIQEATRQLALLLQKP
ncbi:MAG: thiamine phosphate synthase [Gammaproteobacteria bacterium]|nr:thiamine phosphate synthase [Gammaproteobacteria bacterium]